MTSSMGRARSSPCKRGALWPFSYASQGRTGGRREKKSLLQMVECRDLPASARHEHGYSRPLGKRLPITILARPRRYISKRNIDKSIYSLRDEQRSRLLDLVIMTESAQRKHHVPPEKTSDSERCLHSRGLYLPKEQSTPDKKRSSP
jgi:hypothetical protein